MSLGEAIPPPFTVEAFDIASFFFQGLLDNGQYLSFRLPPAHSIEIFTKNSASSFSSTVVRYGVGPEEVPCLTLPDNLSFRVVGGTP